MISRRKAIEIAKKHHGDGFKLFRITYGIYENCAITQYGKWLLDKDWKSGNVWCILCSAYPNEPATIASSRAIIISRNTGNILYDDSAHDEPTPREGWIAANKKGLLAKLRAFIIEHFFLDTQRYCAADIMTL